MRTILSVLLLGLAACTPAPSTSPPTPPTAEQPADPYASSPLCKAQCEDRIMRCRDTPEHPCPTMYECMSTCREPSDPTSGPASTP